MNNIFTYGTLMCVEIMEEVSGCRLSYVPGTLKGYNRCAVRGELYPAIIPKEKGIVHGIVYRDVPMRAWKRLDRFEGEMYLRQNVRIELVCGRILSAETYAAQPALLNQLEMFDWDYAGFLLHGKEIFQKYYKGYHVL